MRKRLMRSCVLAAVAVGGSGLLGAQDGPKIKHVLVISIDGMHSQDLAKWVALQPNSTLAGLMATGVNYPNAFTTQPSDSIPATVGIFTGASPRLAGMYYDDAWHRAWSPPTPLNGLPCATVGTVIDLKQGIDVYPTALDSGGINPDKLPRDPSKNCRPVYPHDMIRVNTVFEVVRAAGMYTAYSEKRPAYDFLNGPSGQGVQDLYVPEIAAVDLLKPDQIQIFDQLRVDSILNEINGRNHDGTAHAPIPALFGMNFQSVNSAKKSSPNSGYADNLGNPDAVLLNALSYVDGATGSMVSALRDQGLLNNTAIVITAKHAESPVGNTRTIVLTSVLSGTFADGTPNILTAAGISTRKVTQKTSALIWLKNQSQTAAAVSVIASSPYIYPNLKQVLSKLDGSLTSYFPDPTVDPAVPDIVVWMKDGVNFEPSLSSTTHAEHGGFGVNESYVPLLVSNPKWTAVTQTATVSTRQIAPTVLALLGLDPQALRAVREESVPAFPDVLAAMR